MERMKTQRTTDDRIAICQHPGGPGEYVPADHVKDGNCFMDCDCTPRVYVALDSILDDAAVERMCRVADAEWSEGKDHTPEGEFLWDEMRDLLEAALTATDAPPDSPSTPRRLATDDALLAGPNKGQEKGKGLNDGS